VRQIKKQQEPKALTNYRLPPGAAWDGGEFTDVKQKIREALVREQGWLCCYCMRRIKPLADSMGVEHWAPRRHGSRELDWSNLLGVCTGDSLAPARAQHCDRSKGDRDLRLDPQSAAHVASLTFPGSGRVRSSDPALQRDLEEILNLNTPNLVNQRKKAVEAFQQSLFRKSGQSLSRERLRRVLKKLDATVDELPPFVAAIEFWLKKRLERQ
jgi:uncharacterized protein (TIGR02646 family)